MCVAVARSGQRASVHETARLPLCFLSPHTLAGAVRRLSIKDEVAGRCSENTDRGGQGPTELGYASAERRCEFVCHATHSFSSNRKVNELVTPKNDKRTWRSGAPNFENKHARSGS